MASLINERNGRRCIQFRDIDGKRRTLRLGLISKKIALSIKTKVEDLISAKITGHAPTDETSRWLADLDDEALVNRLAKLGLTTKRASSTLEKFVDDYIEKRTDVKPSTLRNYDAAKRNLIDYFGTDKPLRDITAGDAIDFRNHLIASVLDDSTTRKRCSIASQFMRNAVKHKLVGENPFDEVPKNVKGSKRRAYVSAADAEAVLAQLPNTEWKLLFTLSRWGGLRVGSEVRRLRWQDIDWENDRFLVHAPKTEHIEGHETRLVPLFPEVAELLRERLEQAEEGDELVLPMLEGRTDQSLRKPILKAAKAAGVSQWTRLWHSLRSSRQTDLELLHPTHIVCSWLGNSIETAKEHYLQVTDADFAAAAGKAVQNPVQHTTAQRGIASHSAPTKKENPGKHCDTRASRGNRVLPLGLEPRTY